MICVGRPDGTATLCSELTSISDWRTLGLYLGVKDYELDQIERSHPTEGCRRWMQEAFSLWLKSTLSASWRDVVGALRRMGEKREAERIELKYIVGSLHASKLIHKVLGSLVPMLSPGQGESLGTRLGFRYLWIL